MEDCLTLDVTRVDLEELRRNSPGFLHWNRGATEIASVEYRVQCGEDGDVLVLEYTATTRRDSFPVRVQEEVELVETRPYFGGSRTWFSCPGCGHRVRALHVPKTERRFRCRDCHGLTYRSVREHDKRVDELVRNPARVERLLNTAGSGSAPFFSPGFFLAMRAFSRLTECH